MYLKSFKVKGHVNTAMGSAIFMILTKSVSRVTVRVMPWRFLASVYIILHHSHNHKPTFLLFTGKEWIPYEVRLNLVYIPFKIIQIQYSIYYHYSWQVMRCTSTKTKIIQLPFPSPHWAPRCEAISVWTRSCSPFSISSCRCCCCINCSCCCCCHWRSSRNRCSSLVCSFACCCSSKSRAGSSATI